MRIEMTPQEFYEDGYELLSAKGLRELENIEDCLFEVAGDQSCQNYRLCYAVFVGTLQQTNTKGETMDDQYYAEDFVEEVEWKIAEGMDLDSAICAIFSEMPEADYVIDELLTYFK